MRIFTSEEATVNALARADQRQQAIAWWDPLAFGRLTADANLHAFGRARAALFASLDWDERENLEADFSMRYQALEEALDADGGLSLLFGGSLRDQLQLAQILHWLSGQDNEAKARVRLMLVDGPLTVFDDGALLEIAKEGEVVDEGVLEAYRAAWLAVTGSDPRNVERVFQQLREAREHLTLATALERWLQELPSWENGLSITENQILDTVRLEVAFPQEIFEAVEETESAPFRTNWEFWQILARLTRGETPLLRTQLDRAFLCPPRDLAWVTFHDQRLELTEAGRSALEGRVHASQLGLPERWWGGTLIDAASDWYWDFGRQAVMRETVPTSASR